MPVWQTKHTASEFLWCVPDIKDNFIEDYISLVPSGRSKESLTRIQGKSWYKLIIEL